MDADKADQASAQDIRKINRSETAKIRRRQRKQAQAQYASMPTQYIKLPEQFECKTCKHYRGGCYLIRASNGDRGTAGQKCASCWFGRCSLSRDDLESRTMLQEWLDAQPHPKAGHTTHAQPNTFNQAISISAIPAANRSQPISLSTKSNDTMLESSHLHDAAPPHQLGRRVLPESASTGGASIEPAPIQPDEKEDTGNQGGAKRPRDSKPLDDTDKAVKAARIDPSSGVQSESTYWLYGLLGSYEKDASTLKAAMAARDQATSAVERQQGIIAAVQKHRTELKAKNNELEKKNRLLEEKSKTMSVERQSEMRSAEDRRLGLERRSLEYEQEVKRITKELETAMTVLEEIKGKAAESTQEEIDKMRTGYQATIHELQTNLRDLDIQVHAGASNAARYRQNELEALDSLSKCQAENSRLVGLVDELTASHEYDVIQLEDAQTNHARVQAVVVDLEGCKAELTTLQARHKNLSAKHTRLSDKLVDAKERIIQLQDKSNVTNDRLEEQQGLNAGISEANAKIEKLEQKVVKLKIKVANAEMAEKTVKASFEHRTGELRKDVEKAYKRINKLEKTVERLRRREQERRDVTNGVVTGKS